MSVISDFFDSLSVATEADDITGVADDAEKAIGGSSGSPAPSDNKEISLNTDDILADDNEKSSSTDEETPTEDEPAEGEDPETDTTEEGAEGDTAEGEDDEFSDPDEDLMDDSNNEEDDFIKTRKKKLWGHYRTFYQNLDSALKLMNKYVPKEIKPEVIHMLTNIKNNLTESKDRVYKILTEEYQKMEYPELLKNFVGLNHIYDLSIKELEHYFDQMASEKKNKK